jgi:L-asparaginase / beta-aspartyl-peptidase
MGEAMSIQPTLIVHGGAGLISVALQQPYQDGVRKAAQLGWEMLNAGRSALDVVEQAVRVLEDDPAFDAGRGSHLNVNGVVEVDALIMDGLTLRYGAVAAVRHLANAVSLARLLIDHRDHSLLVGEGAVEFARGMAFPLVAEEALIVEREMQRWRDAKSEKAGVSKGHDTVGAVARDRDGNIATATSTGGTFNKLQGRVGDSPLIGCGGFADNLLGGASATGVGEDLMKIVACKTTCDLMGSGLDAQAAADGTIRRLEDPRIKGQGGVICIDAQGRTGFAYNTPHMARAYYLPDGTLVVGL